MITKGQDGGNKIYVSSTINDSVGYLVYILGHELTHLSGVFNSMDFYYFDKGFKSDYVDSSERSEAFDRYVKPFVDGVGSEARKSIFSSNAVAFIRLAGFSGLEDHPAWKASIEKFQNEQAFRTKVALETADMLTAFILEVGLLAKTRAGL